MMLAILKSTRENLPQNFLYNIQMKRTPSFRNLSDENGKCISIYGEYFQMFHNHNASDNTTHEIYGNEFQKQQRKKNAILFK